MEHCCIEIADISYSVCHFSQFQEKSEKINGVDVATNLQSDPELNRHPATVVTEDRGGDIEMKEQDCHGASTSPSASQDFVSGVMKVVPADIDVSMAFIFYSYGHMNTNFGDHLRGQFIEKVLYTLFGVVEKYILLSS